MVVSHLFLNNDILGNIENRCGIHVFYHFLLILITYKSSNRENYEFLQYVQYVIIIPRVLIPRQYKKKLWYSCILSFLTDFDRIHMIE